MTQYTYDGQSNNTEHKLTDKRLCEIMLNKNEPDVIKRVYNIYQWIQEVENESTCRLPNSDHNLLLVQLRFREVFWSPILVQPLRGTSSVV
uniref:PDEase domain-containing protein n=1 Tax=Heterorhabditis bacteriophora TaxID=37862 RepID=A0A1I7XJC6_HETBA